MKTLVCTNPGEFRYEEKDRPILQDKHAIIKVKRIGICGTDLHAFEGTQPYFEYPRILGHELAGELFEYDYAPGFEKGEPVSFIPYFNCGNCVACAAGLTNCCVNLRVFGVHVDGGFAEYISVPSYSLLHGEGLSFDELSLVEPLAIGAHGMRRARVKKNEFVLIVGAGPIGIGIAAFASIGGGNVIVMDINTQRLRFCNDNLDVRATINPLSDDPLSRLKDLTNGDLPTVVFDASGNQKAINNSFQYMSHGGRYVLVGLQKGEVTFSHPEFHKKEGTLMSSRNATREDFEYVIETMKKGLVNPTTYITHRVNFGEVKDEFASWLNPHTGVIKATVEIN
jgi:2-desacetyl-2-hydroxyethyl bacteriochlorophyllide A dehydrogenase